MSYKNAYLYLILITVALLISLLFISLQIDLLFSEYLITINKTVGNILKIFNFSIWFDLLRKYKLIYRIPLIICFISHIILFIIVSIQYPKDENNYYKKKYNFFAITIIILFFILSIIFEFINPNSKFLKTLIKPFSDFFGYLIIESNINTILNNKLNNISEKYNNYKVYNNWGLLVNKIKRRIDQVSLKSINIDNIDFNIESDSKNFLFFTDENTENRIKFVELLNLKEDIGYIIWMIIIIILLYNIK